ncbi:MAG: hypothetical protein KFH98_05695 [Gemmatimonadetes bacterium]|nr:hypothetical protein [Gemmatimonadota bacterium]
MFSRTRAAIVLALAATPVALNAQQQAEPPQEVQEWLAEVQQIQQKLQPVQEQALQDEAIQQEQQRAAEAVRAVMIQLDSTMDAKIERFEAIMQEAQFAQATNDQQTIAALTQEAQQLQPQIMEAQAQALEHPDVEPRVAAFQKQLRDKMTELDPDTKPLLDRLDQLEGQLRAAFERQG